LSIKKILQSPPKTILNFAALVQIIILIMPSQCTMDYIELCPILLKKFRKKIFFMFNISILSALKCSN